MLRKRANPVKIVLLMLSSLIALFKAVLKETKKLESSLHSPLSLWLQALLGRQPVLIDDHVTFSSLL
jgi:hypothetical protein